MRCLGDMVACAATIKIEKRIFFMSVATRRGCEWGLCDIMTSRNGLGGRSFTSSAPHFCKLRAAKALHQHLQQTYGLPLRPLQTGLPAASTLKTNAPKCCQLTTCELYTEEPVAHCVALCQHFDATNSA